MIHAMRVSPLIRHSPDLPEACEACVFWQEPRRSVDAPRKERWAGQIRRDFGRWGVVLREEERFRGLLQYGPARAFRRAAFLPAGPPTGDAALITCAYLTDDDPVGVLERLLLEALADLKSRGLVAVETFAHAPDSDASGPHHTLFHRPLLERLGFRPVREEGSVALMRLELGGLVGSEHPALSAAARLADLLRVPRVAADPRR